MTRKISFFFFLFSFSLTETQSDKLVLARPSLRLYPHSVGALLASEPPTHVREMSWGLKHMSVAANAVINYIFECVPLALEVSSLFGSTGKPPWAPNWNVISWIPWGQLECDRPWPKWRGPLFSPMGQSRKLEMGISFKRWVGSLGHSSSFKIRHFHDHKRGALWPLVTWGQSLTGDPITLYHCAQSRWQSWNPSSDRSRIPMTASPNSLIVGSDGKFCIGSESCVTVSSEEGELVKRRAEQRHANTLRLELQFGWLSCQREQNCGPWGTYADPLPGRLEHLLLLASKLNPTPKSGVGRAKPNQNTHTFSCRPAQGRLHGLTFLHEAQEGESMQLLCGVWAGIFYTFHYGPFFIFLLIILLTILVFITKKKNN